MGQPCGACKFLRRKCERGCIFVPCFSYEEAYTHFFAVHNVLEASNESKMLSVIPMSERVIAARTLSLEAQARLRDPVYGCISYILYLEQQVSNFKAQMTQLQLAPTTVAVTNPNEQVVENPNEQVVENPNEPQFNLTHTSNVDNEIMNLNNCVNESHENSVNIPAAENVPDGCLNNEGSSLMYSFGMQWSFEDDELLVDPWYSTYIYNQGETQTTMSILDYIDMSLL